MHFLVLAVCGSWPETTPIYYCQDLVRWRDTLYSIWLKYRAIGCVRGVCAASSVFYRWMKANEADTCGCLQECHSSVGKWYVSRTVTWLYACESLSLTLRFWPQNLIIYDWNRLIVHNSCCWKLLWLLCVCACVLVSLLCLFSFTLCSLTVTIFQCKIWISGTLGNE